jgi:hypothetical protein
LRPELLVFGASWLFVIIGCSSAEPEAVDLPRLANFRPADQGAAVQAKIEPSVVYLQFWTEAGAAPAELAGFGTGFVVADPQKRNWIVTTAHSLAATEAGKKVVCVRYRLPGQEKFAACAKAIVDEGHDLVALRPNPTHSLSVAPLEFQPDNQRIPTTLYALGSASALELALYQGDHIAEVFTAEQWAQRLLMPLSDFQPLSPDVTFLRHGISIAPGYSGCPIVTAEGKVVGIQSSVLKNAPFIGFAIHYKHIRDFNWQRQPEDLEAVDLARSNINRLLSKTSAPPVAFRVEPVTTSQLDARPLTIKLDGIDVEAPFIHNGYVERDALTVIRDHVQDKEWYTEEEFGGTRILRLQELLNRTRLARISNPLLGLQMLVPEGYRYSASPTSNPNGLLVTFSPPAERVVAHPYDWPVSVWVTVEPELYAKGRLDFLELIKSGQATPTERELETPMLFAIFRQGLIDAIVADMVDPRFALHDLGIRVKESDGTVHGKTGSEIFERTLLGKGAWHRNNFRSVSSSLVHNVRIGNRDPLVVIVHHQFKKEDALAFNQLEYVPDVTIQEYLIIAASVSTKRSTP